MGAETESAARTYTEDDFLDYESAWKEAEELRVGFEEAEALGLGDRATERIMAHGRVFALGVALARCKEFGESLREAVEEWREDGLSEEKIRERLDKRIDRKAKEAQEAPVPEAILEREASRRTASELKKN